MFHSKWRVTGSSPRRAFDSWVSDSKRCDAERIRIPKITPTWCPVGCGSPFWHDCKQPVQSIKRSWAPQSSPPTAPCCGSCATELHGSATQSSTKSTKGRSLSSLQVPRYVKDLAIGSCPLRGRATESMSTQRATPLSSELRQPCASHQNRKVSKTNTMWEIQMGRTCNDVALD